MTTSMAAAPVRLCDRPLRPPVIVSGAATLAEVARRMRDENISSVLVGEHGQLAAILTERDLVDAVARNLTPDVPVETIAVADPVTVPPEASVQEAAMLMLRSGIRHLVVAREQQAMAIVSMRDALELLVAGGSTEVVYAVLRQAIHERSEHWLS